MRLKLIAPAKKADWGEDFWSLKTFAHLTGKKAGGAPLALPTLAALTPPDVEVSINDENVEPIDFDEKVDIVGITSITALAPRAYEIADEFRKRGVAVILGGIHASMLPHEAVQHADTVVIGEAERIWKEVIEDFGEGRLRKFYQASYYPDLKNSPIPRWDLLKSHQYCYFTLQVGRGCPYDCDFCSVQLFNGRKYRHKSIEDVVREVRFLQEIDRRKLVFFADDNILSIPHWSESLFKALIPLKIKWWCQASVNRLNDSRLLELMYQSGCRLIFVGFESVSSRSLDLMHKSKINEIGKYMELTDTTHSCGIGVFASFIVGTDSDDPSIFDATIKFIMEANIPLSMINILTPSPGTSLYQRLEHERRIFHKHWEKYNGDSVCFRPKLMSARTLREGYIRVLQQIYSYNLVYKRFKNLWNRGVFVRNRNASVNLFSSGRINFTLRNLITKDVSRSYFVLRGLWNPTGTSIGPILLGLNFHDYASNLS